MLNISHLKTLLAARDSNAITEQIAPLLSDSRKQRIENLLDNRIPSVQIALEQTFDPHNAAAVIRSCEALGVPLMHLIQPDSHEVLSKGVTQGAFNWVETIFHEDFTCFKQSVGANYVLAGAAMEGSVPLSELPADKPICLVIGNESRGLSEQARAECDVLYHIPMFGVSESLNLSVASAISLYDLLSRKRNAACLPGLPEDEKQILRTCFYLKSVSHKLAESILNSPVYP